MRFNMPMVKRRLRRVLARRYVDIRSLAVRTWTLCPEEVVSVPSAIHLDGAMERITGLSPWRNWESERNLVQGGPITHQASTAYLLENVDLAGPYLYCGPAKAQPGYGAEAIVLRAAEPCRSIDTAQLVTSKAGSHFFGTFMLDDMPLSLLTDGNDGCISMVTRPYSHEDGYRALLEIPKAPVVHHARIKRLTTYTDFAQNSSKYSRYQALRTRLRRHVPDGSPAAKKAGVYIRRGRTGELRLLENEIEIEALLRRRGFEIVDPAVVSAQEIARASLDARVVVGVEGSHLSHAIFTVADDGAFLVLQPPDRFSLAYKEFTDRLGIRFAFLVGDKTAGGFSVSLDDLQLMLDRLA